MKTYENLVEEAKRGDTTAFSKLYEIIYQDMYRFALYMLRNTYDAEDVVSETVADVWKGLHTLRKAEAFKAWVFKVLTNKCKMYLKSYLIKTEELQENFPVQAHDACESLDVQRAFADLEEEERLILALHIFGGYNSREIGKSLTLSSNTVRSKQSRALKKMERQLNGEFS